MFEQIKRLIKHSGIYFIGLASQTAVNFLLVPVYSRYLKAEGFGQFEIISNFLQVVLFLLTIGINAAIVKVYVRDATTKKQRRQVVATAFCLTMPLAFLGALAIFIWSDWWAKFLLGGVQFSILFKIIAGTLLLSVFNSLGFAVLRAEEFSRRYTIINIVKFVLFLLLNLWLLISLKREVDGVLTSDLIVQLVAAFMFFASFSAIKHLTRAAQSIKRRTFVIASFSKHYTRKLLDFGLPMIPSTLGMFVVGLSDRYFLRFMTDFTEVGVYSLGYKIGFVIFVIIVSPLQLAWPTFSFDIASKRKDHKYIFSKVQTYFVLVAGLFALILSLFAKELIYIVATPEFVRASTVVPIISLSYVFLGMHFISATGLHIKEKTKLYPIIILVPAVLNLVLNYFFIAQWRMMGAALATLAAFVLTLILTLYFSQKHYPVKYENGRLIKIFLLGGLAYTFSLAGLPGKFTGLFVFVILVWFWVLDKKEIKTLKKIYFDFRKRARLV